MAATQRVMQSYIELANQFQRATQEAQEEIGGLLRRVEALECQNTQMIRREEAALGEEDQASPGWAEGSSSLPNGEPSFAFSESWLLSFGKIGFPLWILTSE